MIKVVIDYRYTREVNGDSAHHKMEFDVVDFDFDMVNKIYEVLDDCGYTVEHVNMSTCRRRWFFREIKQG